MNEKEKLKNKLENESKTKQNKYGFFTLLALNCLVIMRFIPLLNLNYREN